jgi:hypothetical protein
MKANEEVGINPIIDVDKMDWTRVEAISKTLNPPEPEPPTPEPIYTSVTICKISGLLANEWCPDTEIRSFIDGQQPWEVCAVHKAPKPCSWYINLKKGRLNFIGWLKCIFR